MVPYSLRRFVAFIIDLGVMITFLSPLVLSAGALGWLDTSSVRIPWGTFVFVVLLSVLFRFSFLFFVGATLGKWMMGLRVMSSGPLTSRETPLTAGQCWVRALADHLAVCFLWGPFAWALWSPQRRHLGDWLAETRVVALEGGRTLARKRLLAGLLVSWLGFEWGFMQFAEWAEQSSVTASGFVLHSN